MSQYFIYYAESNAVCLIIFALLLTHDLLSMDRQEKQIKYDRALVCFMAYFISDTIWAGIIAGILPKTRAGVLLANLSNFVIMAAITYSWLRFVMATEQTPRRERPLNRFAIVFPLLFSALLLAGLSVFAPQKLVDGSLSPQPVYNVFLITVPSIYLAAILLYTMRRAWQEENPLERRKHLLIGLFPLFVVLGGAVQFIFPETPIFCFCCTILMLTFFIRSMDMRISTDPLTGLKNRGQLIRYVSQSANLHLSGRKTLVFMMDVNDFKAINDNHGHAEGDRALRLVSEALQEVVRGQSMPSFLGRYGGDEFILIAHPAEGEELSSLPDTIQAQIDALCLAQKLPYRLALSIGCEELGERDSFQKCMQRADERLYEQKRRRG